jgi:hypothetical protein
MFGRLRDLCWILLGGVFKCISEAEQIGVATFDLPLLQSHHHPHLKVPAQVEPNGPLSGALGDGVFIWVNRFRVLLE